MREIRGSLLVCARVHDICARAPVSFVGAPIEGVTLRRAGERKRRVRREIRGANRAQRLLACVPFRCVPRAAVEIRVPPLLPRAAIGRLVAWMKRLLFPHVSVFRRCSDAGACLFADILLVLRLCVCACSSDRERSKFRASMISKRWLCIGGRFQSSFETGSPFRAMHAGL